MLDVCWRLLAQERLSIDIGSEAMTIERSDELALLDLNYYNQNGYPWAAWDRIRSEDPLHHITLDNGESYWAVTRYEDLTNIASRPDIFENGPRVTFGDYSRVLPMLVNMDPPQHRKFRELVASRFTPMEIQWVKAYAVETVNRMLDKAMARNGETIDVLTDIVAPVPTATVQKILGVSNEFAPKITKWSEQLFGSFEPEINGGMDPGAFVVKMIQEMSDEFRELFRDREENPGDDLITALIAAKVDGGPLTHEERVGFCFLLVTAGHETTQSAATTGLYTLLQHPEQLAKLRYDLSLMPKAVDEILRFTPPVIHFCRTPNRDVEVSGKTIRKGETMVLFFPAACRDPAKFENPHTFDIERYPNRHLAFGWGAHVCLGMHLGRMQIGVILEQILRRASDIKLMGKPELYVHPATGGVKHLPVQMEIKPVVAA